MAICHTCGGLTVEPNEAERLLALLTDGRKRQVYRGRDGGGWWVTYGGGQFSQNAVTQLIERGSISSCYSDCPDEAYHVGKTLDVKATLAERQKHRRRKDAPHVYTDGTTSHQR